jgi:hypothetical protein
MAKGSRIDRVVEYFRTTGIEEAKYVYQRAGEIVSERQIPMTIQKKLALGGRKKRRTKAQIAAENAQTAAGITQAEQKAAAVGSGE